MPPMIAVEMIPHVNQLLRHDHLERTRLGQVDPLRIDQDRMDLVLPQIAVRTTVRGRDSAAEPPAIDTTIRGDPEMFRREVKSFYVSLYQGNDCRVACLEQRSSGARRSRTRSLTKQSAHLFRVHRMLRIVRVQRFERSAGHTREAPLTASGPDRNTTPKRVAVARTPCTRTRYVMPVSRMPIADLKAHFGKTPGTDRTLVSWDAMRAWLHELADVSPRLSIQSLGNGTEGAPMDMLILSSEETMRNLDTLLAQRRTLTDPSLLADPSHADGTRAGSKPVVLITGGIHATEVGGVQLMPELVRDLSLSEAPDILRILERIIVLIVPTLNPDGMRSIHAWYEQTLGTPAEGTAPPWLYHPYAGHDNNRDWYQHALVETRNAVDGVHRPWRPHLVVDLHQMGEHSPRYVVPPYLDPLEPHVHPLISSLAGEVGTAVASAHIRHGHQGSAFGVLFDCYSPTRAYQHYHGGVRILAEAASAKIATPVDVARDDLKPRRGFDPNLPTVHNPLPWTGGTWRLRDIIDYHLTTIWTVLDHAATHADRWIRDQWAMLAHDVLGTPAAYLIAPLRQQIDPAAAKVLIEILQGGDVTVEYVEEGTGDIQDRSFVVRANQPFGSYARALLDLTPYPLPRHDDQGTRPPAPYDVTSHCLPLHLGVEVRRVEGEIDAVIRPVRSDDFSPFAPPRASDIDRSHWLAVDARSHRAITVVLSALRNRASVRRLLRPHVDAGRLLPAGTWLITDDHVFAVMSEAHGEGLRTWLIRPIPAGTAEQRLPRIGLHVPWKTNAIDAGWMRLVLEQLHVGFDVLRDSDIRAEDLSPYDVLLFPHLAEKDLLQGNSAETFPTRFAGGLSTEGITQIVRYMRNGGHIVAIDGAASALVSALHLPAKRPLIDLKRHDFSCPGSILQIMPDPGHPVTLGMDEPQAVMFTDSSAFVPIPGSPMTSPAWYADQQVLLSGWIHGEEHLHGASAIIDIPVGSGTFTGFGFRPHYRAQMLASYNMLTNALMRPGLQSTVLQR